MRTVAHDFLGKANQREIFIKAPFVLGDMDGLIASYRRGRMSTYHNQMIVVIPTVTSRDAAAKLIGKTVKYPTGKRDILGKISTAHGKKGAVRVHFETGMPGQALGRKVVIE